MAAKKLQKLKVNYHELPYKYLFEFIDSQRADVVLLDMKGKKPTERTLVGVKLKATGQIYFVGNNNAQYFAMSKNLKGTNQVLQALYEG